MGYAVVLVTTPSREEGKKIAQAILERHLAACVNLIPGVHSSFWWEGRLEEAEEALLMIKTKEEAVPRLTEEVQRLHSYSICEVIALPLTQGNQSYLDWIERTVQLKTDSEKEVGRG